MYNNLNHIEYIQYKFIFFNRIINNNNLNFKMNKDSQKNEDEFDDPNKENNGNPENIIHNRTFQREPLRDITEELYPKFKPCQLSQVFSSLNLQSLR
ncbi:hypothetical protein pb186bvf_014918 [Paramecium bursaria]